jgi:hypothetical protein
MVASIPIRISTREKYYIDIDVAESSCRKTLERKMNTGLIMTDVVVEFAGIQPSTVRHTSAPFVDPKISRWIIDWLSD